jgi:hypothetical protein
MATQATVSLVVDETGAVAGLNRFNQRATASLSGATTQARALNVEMNAVGNAGTVAGDKMSAGFQKATGHALTNLDSVRLLRDDLGVHIPRAMEKLIASTAAFQAVASIAFSTFAAVGIVELVGTLGKRIYDAFSKGGEEARALAQDVADLNIQMRNTNDSLDLQIAKLQEERAKLEGKPRDGIHLALLEDIDAAETLAAKLKDVFATFQTDLAKMGGNAFVNLLTGGTGTGQEQKMAVEHAKWLSQQTTMQGVLGESQSFDTALQQRLSELRGKQADSDKARAAVDAARAASRTRGGAVPGATVADYTEEIKATEAMIDFNKKQQVEIQKTIDLNKEQDRLDQARASKEAGDTAMRERQQAIELVARLQREATEAGMQGEELANQRRLDQIEETTRRLTALKQAYMIPGAVQEINDAYFAEQGQRIVEMQNKAALAISQYRIQAMPEGEDKIRAEHDQQVNRNNISLTGDDRSAANVAAEAEMNRKLDQLRQENQKKQDEADNEAQQQIRRNQQRDLDYDRQAADAERRVKSDGLQGWVSDHQAAVAAIEARRTELRNKLRDEYFDEGIEDEEYYRREVDIARTASAEIQEENQRMAHQVSQTLQDAFTNPVEFIKSRMQKMFFDIIADWIERSKLFQSVFGSAASNGAGGMLGSIMTGSAPWSHASIGGVTSQTSGVSVGSVIPGSGGMVMTPAGPVPTFDPNSPAYQHFVSNGVPGSTSPGVGGSIPSGGGGGLPPNTWPGSGGGSGGGSSAAASGIGKAAGVGYAGYSGYEDTVAAYKSGSVGGMMKGAMGDAMAGAMIGSMFGPAGTLIGAGIGAAIGLTAGAIGMIEGEGGRIPARDYYKKSIFPALENDRNNSGSQDFQTAVSDVNRKAADGMVYMRGHWGTDAANWVNQNYLMKEQASVLSQIESRARGGSQYVSMSANQFHSGGAINGFGDLATSSNEGFIHAMLGEAVVNPPAYSAHRPAVDAMNAGASPEAIAAMYARPSDSGGAQGPDLHVHIHTLDSRTTDSWMRNGGARMIAKHLNNFNTQYAGDGISG